MKTVFRALMTAVVVVAIYFFVFWMSAAFLPGDTSMWVSTVIGWVCAGVAGWFVWARSAASTGRRGGQVLTSMIFGAITVGALGFALGFFGPMILTPESNQGPLLGLFMTGPAGFILGAVGGLLYARGKRPAAGNPFSPESSQLS